MIRKTINRIQIIAEKSQAEARNNQNYGNNKEKKLFIQ
jgi:hypothetical protein